MIAPLYYYLWPPVTSTDSPPPWFTSSFTCCHCRISLPAGHSPAHSTHWLPSCLPFQCKCSPVLELVCTGKAKVAQLCPTLCDPMDYTVHEILQARVLEWVVISFSRGSFQPRDLPSDSDLQCGPGVCIFTSQHNAHVVSQNKNNWEIPTSDMDLINLSYQGFLSFLFHLNFPH